MFEQINCPLISQEVLSDRRVGSTSVAEGKGKVITDPFLHVLLGTFPLNFMNRSRTEPESWFWKFVYLRNRRSLIVCTSLVVFILACAFSDRSFQKSELVYLFCLISLGSGQGTWCKLKREILPTVLPRNAVAQTSARRRKKHFLASLFWGSFLGIPVL